MVGYIRSWDDDRLALYGHDSDGSLPTNRMIGGNLAASAGRMF